MREIHSAPVGFSAAACYLAWQALDYDARLNMSVE